MGFEAGWGTGGQPQGDKALSACGGQHILLSRGLAMSPGKGWQLPCSLSGQMMGWHNYLPESSTWTLLLRMSS